ncbi:MBL fold metallo-hydrolase [Phenylobacterium montanum]|uniref:MBL fold metallo-hydrolase n=1 Tax=Phenylobacterium montanum TaxID=2823693 RepID=A0A975G485_9CAUL|nr:MBL fold metallo-hydrolase [Caulobacter sp. S6]QUD90278.1 MBL fold metallo-hydrolase [Caulobacter sp. S6]
MSPKIHTYSAAESAFYVNSFLIEGHDSVIVIDTQFLVSSARDLRKQLDALEKPLAAVIISHPHPDHYNGLPVLLEGLPPTPVYATRATIDAIQETQPAKRAAWTPIYGDDYPKADALPNKVVGADDRLTIAGVELRMIDLGPGESSDITVIHLPGADALLASDLIYNNCHPWLAEARTEAWLRQIDEIEQRFGDVSQVHAGHGPAGGPELFEDQRKYIQEFRNVVARFAHTPSLDASAMAEIRSETTRNRASWPLDLLIDMNATAIFAELTGG